jgi:predicted ATPase
LTNTLALAACQIALWRGQQEEVDRYLAMLEDESSRHGIEIWRPVALYYRGALACLRDEPEAVPILERAIADLDRTNFRMRMPLYLGTLAGALAASGRLGEAAAKSRAALDRAHAQNERWCLPELLRIQASILAVEGRSSEAETLLVRAMALAREIGALSWRLRSANDLAKLWSAQSRADDARRMLLPIYQEFTEGLGARDLVVAANLLASLPRA